MKDPAEEAAGNIFPLIFSPIGGAVGAYGVSHLAADCTGGVLTPERCENPFRVDPLEYAIFLDSEGAQILVASLVAVIAWAIAFVWMRYARSS